jgi:hypothetical protein
MGSDEMTKKIQCCYCAEGINLNAKVCASCGRYQNSFLNWVNSANLISLLMLLIAGSELYQARETHTEASLAREQALTAKQEALTAMKDAELAKNDAQRANRDVQQSRSELQKVIKIYIENGKISSATRTSFAEGPSSPRLKLYDENLENLASFVEPDPKKRRAWLNEIEKKIGD